MQLNNFNSAWKQLKLLNAMQQIESEEILSIIERSEKTNRSKLRTVALTLGVFIVITFFFQGG